MVYLKKSTAEIFSVRKNALTYWIPNKEDIIWKYKSGQLKAKRQRLSVRTHDCLEKAVCF